MRRAIATLFLLLTPILLGLSIYFHIWHYPKTTISTIFFEAGILCFILGANAYMLNDTREFLQFVRHGFRNLRISTRPSRYNRSSSGNHFAEPGSAIPLDIDTVRPPDLLGNSVPCQRCGAPMGATCTEGNPLISICFYSVVTLFILSNFTPGGLYLLSLPFFPFASTLLIFFLFLAYILTRSNREWAWTCSRCGYSITRASRD